MAFSALSTIVQGDQLNMAVFSGTLEKMTCPCSVQKRQTLEKSMYIYSVYKMDYIGAATPKN